MIDRVQRAETAGEGHNGGHPDEGEEPSSYEKTFPENRARGSADTDAIEIEQERRVAGT